jgi:hypothetical protein
MNNNCYLQQRNVIKFLTKLEKSGSEIYEMLKQCFNEEAISCAHVFFWTKEFFNCRESVEDELRNVRSFSSIQKELFCKSTFHRVKLLINTVTLQFWNIYESGFGKKTTDVAQFMAVAS